MVKPTWWFLSACVKIRGSETNSAQTCQENHEIFWCPEFQKDTQDIQDFLLRRWIEQLGSIGKHHMSQAFVDITLEHEAFPPFHRVFFQWALLMYQHQHTIICICIRTDVTWCYTLYMVLYLHINREGNQLRHFDGWLSLLRANRTISKTSPSFKWKIICHGQCLLHRGLLTRLGFSFIKLPGVFQLQRLRCSEYVAGMLDTKLVMQCYLSKRREQQMERISFWKGRLLSSCFQLPCCLNSSCFTLKAFRNVISCGKKLNIHTDISQMTIWIHLVLSATFVFRKTSYRLQGNHSKRLSVFQAFFRFSVIGPGIGHLRKLLGRSCMNLLECSFWLYLEFNLT